MNRADHSQQEAGGWRRHFKAWASASFFPEALRGANPLLCNLRRDRSTSLDRAVDAYDCGMRVEEPPREIAIENERGPGKSVPIYHEDYEVPNGLDKRSL